MASEYDANQLWRHNTIEEKMNIASQQLALELAVIEPMGDVRYKTDALSESVLSLLRNRRQALLKMQEKSFPGITLRALSIKSQPLGWLVVEQDVAEALRSGKLRALGQDAFDREPITPENPLLQAPNAWLTPHMGWAPHETRERLIRMVADNIRCYLEGRPINVVNP